MKKASNNLSLPRPWRLLFQDVEQLKTDSAQYALLFDLAGGGAKSFPVSQLGRWDVDQGKGTFFATLIDGQTLNAEVRFIGTHDGRDFQWADSNPSIDADLTKCATKLRENLPPELSRVGQSDRPAISRRDVLVLLGLAASVCDCDLVISAPSNGTQIAMLLVNATFSEAAPDKPAKKNGLLSRIFGKGPERTPTLSAADQLAALRETVEVAMNQWQQNLLPDKELRALEPDLASAYAFMQANDVRNALDLLNDLQKRLGGYPQDQEPTGWVYLCEGIAAMQTDDLPRARAAFAVAGRAITPVPATLLRVAKARASEAQDRDHELRSAYLVSPTKFAEIATSDEVTIVKGALDRLTSARGDNTPEAILHHAIKALYDVEVAAHNRSEAARKTRDSAHIMAPADYAARLAINKEYADLLLTLATPLRSPELGSYSSNPECDPDLIEAIKKLSRTEDVAEFVVSFKEKFSDAAVPYKYTLRHITMPLAREPDWRLDQITAGLDFDSYRLF